MLDKLYERYGRLVIQAEIIQGQINEAKRLIADELGKASKLPTPKVEKVETKK